jgi:hypothetical protein
LEKRAEQFLPGSEREVREEEGGREEKWLKQCMHI